MTPFTRLVSIACPLDRANIDTDQLIPARFMKRSRAEGYGDYLLHDLRRDDAGALDPRFPLNDPRWSGAQILIAGRNFGGGSSREAAVYALADFGIRCVIAPSIGDIFGNNAINNGLLPVILAESDCRRLSDLVRQGDGVLTVDLEAQEIRCGTAGMAFAIDPVRRMKLLNGWDDIGLTASRSADIAAFRRRDGVSRPWAYPAPGGTAQAGGKASACSDQTESFDRSECAPIKESRIGPVSR